MKLALTGAELPSRKTLRMLAALSLVLFLAVQLFAASAALHHALHAEAGTPGHHCVLTLMTQGQVSPACVPLQLAAFLAALLYCQPALKSAALFSPLYRLSPSRAPPGL